ncbi:glycosyltransferase family 4 protein [Marinicrinis sediminis]|uniref:Glycosyltransferase family 4 protein n=1 Tax=Marinicrinis sediminis TaxID=1652465 RepID=A0ABW5R664_9BACL
MIQMNFQKHYQIIHFTNEIGKNRFGGVGTYINEWYAAKENNIGFVYLYDSMKSDIYIDDFPGKDHILAIPLERIKKINDISFDIGVIHYYGMQTLLDEDIFLHKRLVYVIHCIPSTEPYNLEDPFGKSDIHQDFQRMCEKADLIICVSSDSKNKLIQIFPQFKEKTHVIYNGLNQTTPSTTTDSETVYHRKKFGYIGRLEYRKGLMECLTSVKDKDVELYIACGNDDPFYLSGVLDYIEGANMLNRVHFLGLCQGERKWTMLREMDAIIIPSLYESFGYVLLEAMFARVPVICTSIGGIKEILGDYKYQFNPYIRGDLQACISSFQEDKNSEITTQLDNLVSRTDLFTTPIMIEKYKTLFSEQFSIN